MSIKIKSNLREQIEETLDYLNCTQDELATALSKYYILEEIEGDIRFERGED